jgi:hypothetical protein
MRIHILLVLILFQTCLVNRRTFPDGFTQPSANHDRHGRLRYIPQSLRFRQQIDEQIRRPTQDTSISDRRPFTAQPASVRTQLSAATFSRNTSLLFLMRLQL